jgi:hypothetical protein
VPHLSLCPFLWLKALFVPCRPSYLTLTHAVDVLTAAAVLNNKQQQTMASSVVCASAGSPERMLQAVHMKGVQRMLRSYDFAEYVECFFDGNGT